MRKRIVIGAIAAVAIGIAAYVLSQPEEGSLGWHEREYWKAREGGPLVMGLLRWALGMGASAQTEEDIMRMSAHETALIISGRLVERIILVSNQPAEKVLLGAWPAIAALGPMRMESDVVFFDVTTTNSNRLITRTNDAAARLSRWEGLIRQADFPLTK